MGRSIARDQLCGHCARRQLPDHYYLSMICINRKTPVRFLWLRAQMLNKDGAKMKLIGTLAFIFSIAVMQTAAAEDFDQCDGSSPDADAQPLVRIPPALPDTPEAKKTATVVVCFDVPAEGGLPENVRIVSSTDAYFNMFSTRSVERWRYQPKIVDGEPVPRHSVIATLRYFNDEDRAAYEEANRLKWEEAQSAKRATQLEENSYCRAGNEILEIETQCICAVADVTTLYGDRAPRPKTDGYIGYVSESEMRRIGLEKFRAHYLQPARLTGNCTKSDLCTEGVPVDGPVEACAFFSNWHVFMPEENTRVIQRGSGNKYPRVYLQNLPTKSED